MTSILKEKNVRLSFPQRLVKGTKTWQTVVRPTLAKRAMMLRALESGYFSRGEDGEGSSHPINLIDRGLSILIPYLVMSNPQLLITTKKKELRPFAMTTELAFNHLIKEIKFARNSLRPVVRDAMLGLGIMKTGIMKESEVDIYGHTHAVGQVYSDPIDVVDYIGDATATCFEGFEFEGNFYRMPIEAAREEFHKHRDILNPSYRLNGSSDQYNPEKIAKPEGEYQSLKEYVQLMDIWVPDERVILTIEPHSATILRTIEAETPEGGPYDKLYFKEFPGTAMPIPPVWYWMDLDTTLNIIVNKMRKQAEAQKTVLAYEGDGAEDAERLAAAPDQKAIKVTNVDGMKDIKWDGIDPQHYQWISYLEQQYSMQGNNLYTLGGQGTGAATLGQDQLSFANASKSVDDMTEAVYDFTKSISNKMCWFFWSDPLISVPQVKRIDGYGDIEVTFDRAARDGEFWDYEFEVEPYSMQRLSPSVEFNRVLSLLTQWILPSAQIGAQQGASLNVPKVTKYLGKLAGIRGMDDWYETAVPNQSTQLNPYTPTSGKVKSKDVQDGRTGNNPNSSAANSRQKQEKDGNVV
jgi:hypothetical protein